MYHVLIFYKGDRYLLDLAGTAEESGAAEASFESLDDLVAFAVGHELRVDEDDVTLQEPVPCEPPEPTSSLNGGTSEYT